MKLRPRQDKVLPSALLTLGFFRTLLMSKAPAPFRKMSMSSDFTFPADKSTCRKETRS